MLNLIILLIFVMTVSQFNLSSKGQLVELKNLFKRLEILL